MWKQAIVELAEREQFSFNLLATGPQEAWSNGRQSSQVRLHPSSHIPSGESVQLLTDEEARALGREAAAKYYSERSYFLVQEVQSRERLRALEMVGSYGNAFRLQYTIDERLIL